MYNGIRISAIMTTYNVGNVIELVINSIFEHGPELIDEFIIVDSKSTDGTFEKLSQMSKNRPMKIISLKCLRGKGLQTAFTHTNNELIMVLDGDTVYNEKWPIAVKKYIDEKYDFPLTMWFCKLFPRHLVEKVNGWNNLQYLEDLDIRSRMSKIKQHRYYPMECGENLKRNPSSTIFEKSYREYRKLHDKILLARHISYFQWTKGIWLRIRALTPFVPTLIKSVYHMSIFNIAWLFGNIRRHTGTYGSFSENVDYSREWIDFGLGTKIDDLAFDHRYDTQKQIRNALRRGDYGFVPKLYD